MNTATLPRGGNAGVGIGAAGVVIAGGFSIWQLMAHGHAAFNTTSNGLMWGLPIITYDFFLMTSAGLGIVAALWTVFGIRDFEPSARRALWLALAMLAGGVASLFLELGHPLRALWAIPLNLQVTAPLFWKVLAIGTFAVCLLVISAGWLRGTAERPGRGVSIVSLAAAVLIIFLGSMMYATLPMRPFWYSGELPILFLVEGLLGALALLMLLGSPMGPGAGRTAALLVALLLLLELGRLAVGFGSNVDGMQVWQALVASPLFWLKLVVCYAVALVLFARGAQGAAQSAAALALLVGLFIGKYEFVVGGQVVPLFKGSWVRGLIPYAPSLTEWMLLVTSVFLAYAIYSFGASRFGLGASR